ncbi:MAG: DoxX family protein [Acidobacteria bacterium]|nr:MAG: DoxX family protein [Acidobacteriota bacterium]
MILSRLSRTQTTILLVLRIAIGWHFLYEGVAKLLIPGWTSAPYLQTARGLFAGIFHTLGASPGLLKAVDQINIWGLILIGLALVLGGLTRVAAIAGICFLVLYYVAHPPLIGTDLRMPTEGHYLFVDKNLVELLALGILLFFPTKLLPGLDRLFSGRKAKATGVESTAQGTTAVQPTGAEPMTRRSLVANLASIPLLGVFSYGAARKYKWEKAHAITGATIKLQEAKLEELKGELPKGKLGKLEATRLILGCNLIGGWAHSRDLIYTSSLFKAYNTDRKVFETIELAERAGITMMQVVTAQMPLFQKYVEIIGGKMQTMCQVYPTVEDMKTDIDKAIDAGCTTLYVQGAHAEKFVKNGKTDMLAKALEYMKSQGYASGIGSHTIEVPIACEKAGMKPDYYVKTLHHDQYWSAHPREFREEWTIDGKPNPEHHKFHDNMWDLFPERTVEFMKTVEVPWVAFKVLAGGAIHPKDGFKYAFENGADFICVGMFDFQIVEDVNITIDTLKAVQRQRNWLS